VLDEHVGHVLFAELEMEGEGVVVVAGEETHAGGFDWGDDEASLVGGDLPESGGAGLLNFGVGRKIFERQDVVSGEAEYGFAREGAGKLAGTEGGGVEGLGRFVVGDDDETGGVGGSDEEGKIEGAGSEGQTRDTSAPRASAQVAAYTLKSVRMLQVRQELADEGKNHAGLILVELRFSAS
jgi:hypothetical protein